MIISNFGREIRVPLTEVEKIKRGQSGTPIKLVLRHDTGFGRSIEFWPSLYPGYMRPWTPHPLVAELQGLVRQRGGSIEREP